MHPQPHLLLLFAEHPQLVAVKSLILIASDFVYGLFYVSMPVNVSKYLIENISGLLIKLRRYYIDSFTTVIVELNKT